MNFTTKDTNQLKEYYLNFLKNLKTFLLENNINDINSQFNVVHYLLENAYFTDELNMILDDKYQFISIPTALNAGIQVMNGICCCRHANELLFKLFQDLNYDCHQLFVYVDSKHTWHIKRNAYGSNHLAITVQLAEEQIILDLFNDQIFKVSTTGQVISLKQNLSIDEEIVCKKYSDEENIKPISKILKQYYAIKDLGIKRIYDDEIYGEY